MPFRILFQDITQTNEVPGIDPLGRCLTIASACNLVLRRNVLQQESVGIIPDLKRNSIFYHTNRNICEEAINLTKLTNTTRLTEETKLC